MVTPHNPKGAGRKKAQHTIEAEAARKRVVETVIKRMDELLDAQFALALGHYEDKIFADGRRRVYKAPPDEKAIEYLMNRTFGKPTESVEMGGIGGKPIALQVISYADVDNPDPGVPKGH